MRIEEIESELVRIINKYKDTQIPRERIDDILCLATHNEIPLAVEIFCGNLDDFEVCICREDLDSIIKIGRLTGANEAEWKDLRVI